VSVGPVNLVMVGLGCFSLFMSAFFSGCETGYMTVSRVRLRNLRTPDDPLARRLRRHLRHIEDPILTCLIGTNLWKSVPVLMQYRFLRSFAYQFPASLNDPFAVAVSPVTEEGREQALVDLLGELGITQSLLRVPSWERERLEIYERFLTRMRGAGIEVLVALLQRRKDVLEPQRWDRFLEEAFSRLGGKGALFEVGHAWNRTKWGVWDHREYLRLARLAQAAARKHEIRLVGPAVIDFEFHLYPPVLKHVDFDIISSLLYVDRTGPPEGRQFGWDTTRKLALLRAIVDMCTEEGRDLWITEVNWPLKDTGEYSPAAGRPNVSEEEQADYLVRYYLLCLCSGWVDRIYWWQLVAPGYGLVDSRSLPWRKRPSFYALKTLKRFCGDSVYQGRFVHPGARIFNFCRGKDVFAVGWTERGTVDYRFPSSIKRVISRGGEELAVTGRTVTLDTSPRYVFFENLEGVGASRAEALEPE